MPAVPGKAGANASANVFFAFGQGGG